MPKFVTIQYGHVARWWREAASTDPAESGRGAASDSAMTEASSTRSETKEAIVRWTRLSHFVLVWGGECGQANVA